MPAPAPAEASGPPGGARAQRAAHRKSPPARRPRLSRRDRLVAITVLFIGVLTIGLATGFGAESSAEPTVRAFLFDWSQQHYDAAAALTTGAPSAVVTAMQTELTDLDATAMFLSMGPVSQSGRTAEASFNASVDLAEGGHQWNYTGHLTLRSVGSGWKVQWAPSVINPSLGPGDRLAVLTTYKPRAQVQDSSGHSLLTDSVPNVIGVYPGKLSDAAGTASRFASIAKLDPVQVLGQIRAAPPSSFLPLLTLDQATFNQLLPQLRKVPGLTDHRPNGLQAFGSVSSDLVGQVGTENSSALLAQGESYQPGATIGISGIEKTYQTALVGTPSTDVMVVNSAGKVVSTLHHWAGTAGTPIRTTISGPVQAAAASALGSSPGSSGEIIAVDASTGAILADVEHDPGQELPLGGTVNAKAQPGMAFTIVSAAALLQTGYPVNRQVPCQGSTSVGGQTFTTSSATSSPPPFASDFANGCVTAFANLSQLLNSSQLGEMEKGFGVGMTWNLPGGSFSGSADVPAGAGLAADAIGRGGVRMSPLGMALVAAEVDKGVGHAPAILEPDPPARPSPLSASALVELRGLMRQAVSSGAAHAADVSGGQVFGQAGLIQTGHTWLSWFTGYRGNVAFTVLETGSTATQAAAAMAGAFLSAMR